MQRGAARFLRGALRKSVHTAPTSKSRGLSLRPGNGLLPFSPVNRTLQGALRSASAGSLDPLEGYEKPAFYAQTHRPGGGGVQSASLRSKRFGMNPESESGLTVQTPA